MPHFAPVEYSDLPKGSLQETTRKLFLLAGHDLRERRAERSSLDALVTLAERARLNLGLRTTRPYKTG
ncbi:MAG: hypothetical protein HY848_03445 [Betaproteobacteria bacterium]|nr:hypothetical protein [Betaproteobacteria bacterium]